MKYKYDLIHDVEIGTIKYEYKNSILFIHCQNIIANYSKYNHPYWVVQLLKNSNKLLANCIGTFVIANIDGDFAGEVMVYETYLQANSKREYDLRNASGSCAIPILI